MMASGSRAEAGTVVAPRSIGRGLQVWSLVLPVLKCAFCPVCLSAIGGLLSGARLGVLGDERYHAWLIAVAVVADLAILRAAARHHGNSGPLWLCAAGAALAGLGHAVGEVVEMSGFVVLMAAAVWNVVLIRRHHGGESACCAHGHAHHESPVAASANARP